MKGTKVLIVEQLDTLAGVLEVQLKQQGFSVTGIAASIAEAVSLAKADNPDVIIIDTQIQGSVTILSQLRGLENHHGKVIFLGFSEGEFSSESDRLYLLKPFSINELVKKICESLEC